MNTEQILHLSLIGSGGDGVMATASMLLRTAAKAGLYGMMTQSYGPQIRGGESAAHITIGAEPVQNVSITKDIVVCFRFSDVGRFTKEVRAANHTAIFHGADAGDVPEILQAAKGLRLAIPFQDAIAKEGLPEIAKNVFVFGILLRAFGWDVTHGEACVREVFSHKSSAVQDSNIKALIAGYRHVENIALPFRAPQPKGTVQNRLVLSGNEACARAAIAAGCRFYAGYPITPSSEILETMDELLPTVGGKLIQAEDEIAALGMVVGASYGGVQAMTATSGPGLSLMTEMLGLASIAELPVVVVDCQRGGPSTGIPSRTEQSDLWHAVYGGHGDFPRVVLAPTDVTDCYKAIFRAFYCAEKYQMPAIVLSDASIAQRAEVINRVDTSSFPRAKRLLSGALDSSLPAGCRETAFKRFDLRALEDEEWSGVTPMALPGTPGAMHSIAGIEHTEKGTPSADGAQHELMNQKRFRKLSALAEECTDWYMILGNPKAPHALVAWGSTVGVAREFMNGHDGFAIFVPEIVHPFPIEGLKRFLAGKKSVRVIEMNFQGQLYQHLKAAGALPEGAMALHRSGGLPFQVEELELMITK